MTDPSAYRPPPRTLAVDEDVSVPTKPDYMSSTIWGLIVTAVGFIVALLVQSKKIPESMGEQLRSVGLFLGIAIAGFVTAWLGRRNAVQPLSFTVVRKVGRIKVLIPFALAILVMQSGCATTPVTQVEVARRTYVGGLQVVVPLLESGAWNPDMNTRQLLLGLKNDVKQGLEDAEAQIAATQKLDAKFFADHVQGPLTKFIVYVIQARRSTKTPVDSLSPSPGRLTPRSDAGPVSPARLTPRSELWSPRKSSSPSVSTSFNRSSASLSWCRPTAAQHPRNIKRYSTSRAA